MKNLKEDLISIFLFMFAVIEFYWYIVTEEPICQALNLAIGMLLITLIAGSIIDG